MKAERAAAALVLILVMLLLSGCAGPPYDNDTPPDQLPARTEAWL